MKKYVSVRGNPHLVQLVSRPVKDWMAPRSRKGLRARKASATKHARELHAFDTNTTAPNVQTLCGRVYGLVNAKDCKTMQGLDAPSVNPSREQGVPSDPNAKPPP